MQTESTFPQLSELVGFFECEPALLDADVPWFVNRITFAAVRGDVTVQAIFEPAEGFMDISLRAAGQEIAAAQVRALGDVTLHQDAGRETLSATFGSDYKSRLWLSLKPAPRLQIEGLDGVVP
jgi:hypothetical protein